MVARFQFHTTMSFLFLFWITSNGMYIIQHGIVFAFATSDLSYLFVLSSWPLWVSGFETQKEHIWKSAMPVNKIFCSNWNIAFSKSPCFSFIFNSSLSLSVPLSQQPRNLPLFIHFKWELCFHENSAPYFSSTHSHDFSPNLLATS